MYLDKTETLIFRWREYLVPEKVFWLIHSTSMQIFQEIDPKVENDVFNYVCEKIDVIVVGGDITCTRKLMSDHKGLGS